MLPNVEKRNVDRIALRSTMLEDMVFELRRRNIQIIHGRGIGLRGRVVFLPEPLENVNEGQETRGRGTGQPTHTEGMVISLERQGVHDLDTQGNASSKDGESRGLDSRGQGDQSPSRVQGGERQESVVQSTETTPTSEPA